MSTQDFLPGDEVVARLKLDLAEYETERAKAYGAVRWRVPLFMALLLAAAAAVAYAFNSLADPYEKWVSTPHLTLYALTFVAAFFVYAAAMKPATKLRQSFRERILPVIFGFIKDFSYRQGRTPDSFGRLPREAAGTFNRQRFDDVVSGSYEGFKFELYEADLEHKAGKNTTDVFKGIIVAFETTTHFPGLLVAARQSGTVTRFFRDMFGAKLQELDSGIEEIDKAYDFRTDNVEAARPLVTGRMAQALKWLKETWPEQQPRLALSGSDGFLLIPLRKNFFELPGISTPLDYKAHVEAMVADMGSLLATAALVRKVGAKDEGPESGNQA